MLQDNAELRVRNQRLEADAAAVPRLTMELAAEKQHGAQLEQQIADLRRGTWAGDGLEAIVAFLGNTDIRKMSGGEKGRMISELRQEVTALRDDRTRDRAEIDQLRSEMRAVRAEQRAMRRELAALRGAPVAGSGRRAAKQEREWSQRQPDTSRGPLTRNPGAGR